MKDWLTQTIIEKSQAFLAAGQEVQPIFFGVRPQGNLLVVPFSRFFRSEAGKEQAVALGRLLVKTHQLHLTALVHEAWLNKVKHPRPNQGPARQEILIIILETPFELEVTTIPICQRRLELAQMQVLTEAETRFRFFGGGDLPPLAA